MLTREGTRADPYFDVKNARRLPGIFVFSGGEAVSYVSQRIGTLELEAF
jgi:hypothetical protein